jgi:hypothetical protein
VTYRQATDALFSHLVVNAQRHGVCGIEIEEDGTISISWQGLNYYTVESFLRATGALQEREAA